MPKYKLLPCPFCGGKVKELRDDMGGSCIEHIEGHRDGCIQKCILTDVQINTSSHCYAGWNTRKGATNAKA